MSLDSPPSFTLSRCAQRRRPAGNSNKRIHHDAENAGASTNNPVKRKRRSNKTYLRIPIPSFRNPLLEFEHAPNESELVTNKHQQDGVGEKSRLFSLSSSTDEDTPIKEKNDSIEILQQQLKQEEKDEYENKDNLRFLCQPVFPKRSMLGDPQTLKGMESATNEYSKLNDGVADDRAQQKTAIKDELQDGDGSDAPEGGAEKSLQDIVQNPNPSKTSKDHSFEESSTSFSQGVGDKNHACHHGITHSRHQLLATLVENFMKSDIDPHTVTTKQLFIEIRKLSATKLSKDDKDCIKSCVASFFAREGGVGKTRKLSVTSSVPPSNDGSLQTNRIQTTTSTGEVNCGNEELPVPLQESNDNEKGSTKPAAEHTIVTASVESNNALPQDMPSKGRNRKKLECSKGSKVPRCSEETDKSACKRASSTRTGKSKTVDMAAAALEQDLPWNSEQAKPAKRGRKPAPQRGGCTVCKTCPCRFLHRNETGCTSELHWSDAAVEKSLIQQLLKLEKTTERYANQQDVIRRKLKSHRRDLWQRRERLIELATSNKDKGKTWFLMDVDECDTRFATEARKTPSTKLRSIRAQDKLFGKAPRTFQTTLTQLMGDAKDDSGAELESDPTKLEKILGTREENVADDEKSDGGGTADHSEGLGCEDGLGDTESDQSTSSSGLSPNLPARRVEWRQGIEIQDDYLCNEISVWGSLLSGHHRAAWDKLFEKTEDTENPGMETLYELCEQLESGDLNQEMPLSSRRVDATMLSQGARLVSEEIIKQTATSSDRLRALETECPAWQENVMFAMHQNSLVDVDTALNNIRAEKSALLAARAEILNAFEQREVALTVFEEALHRSRRRLVDKMAPSTSRRNDNACRPNESATEALEKPPSSRRQLSESSSFLDGAFENPIDNLATPRRNSVESEVQTLIPSSTKPFTLRDSFSQGDSRGPLKHSSSEHEDRSKTSPEVEADIIWSLPVLAHSQLSNLNSL